MNRVILLSSSFSSSVTMFRSVTRNCGRMTGSTSGSSNCYGMTTTKMVPPVLSLRTMATTKTTFDLPDPSSASSSSSSSTSHHHHQRPLVKIIATIGPTSEQEEPLYHCVQAGMNSMRLNFSHATPEEVELRCTNLQSAIMKRTHTKGQQLPNQDTVSVLLDTKGPELRTGKLLNDISGHDTIELIAGSDITLHGTIETLPSTNNGGSTIHDLYIPFEVLASVVQPNRTVLLDDGAIVLSVISTNIEKNTVLAKIQNTGQLRSRAGVNLPLADTALHLPALSVKDQSDILYGMTHADIDYVAASFVQTSQHVIDIRQHMINIAQTLPQWKDKPLPLIISKIETASALQHFDDILDVSDGIMVARGDVRVTCYYSFDDYYLTLFVTYLYPCVANSFSARRFHSSFSFYT
jgi:pyruvate kinase